MSVRFVLVEPSNPPRVVEGEDNTLDTLRAFVGGDLVGCGPLSANIACSCDDEGEPKGLPYAGTPGDFSEAGAR